MSDRHDYKCDTQRDGSAIRTIQGDKDEVARRNDYEKYDVCVFYQLFYCGELFDTSAF